VVASENLDLLINNKQITKPVVEATAQDKRHLHSTEHLGTPEESPVTHLSSPQNPDQRPQSTEHTTARYDWLPVAAAPANAHSK
jgi:hypothetical protein